MYPFPSPSILPLPQFTYSEYHRAQHNASYHGALKHVSIDNDGLLFQKSGDILSSDAPIFLLDASTRSLGDLSRVPPAHDTLRTRGNTSPDLPPLTFSNNSSPTSEPRELLTTPQTVCLADISLPPFPHPNFEPLFESREPSLSPELDFFNHPTLAITPSDERVLTRSPSSDSLDAPASPSGDSTDPFEILTIASDFECGSSYESPASERKVLQVTDHTTAACVSPKELLIDYENYGEADVAEPAGWPTLPPLADSTYQKAVLSNTEDEREALASPNSSVLGKRKLEEVDESDGSEYQASDDDEDSSDEYCPKVPIKRLRTARANKITTRKLTTKPKPRTPAFRTNRPELACQSCNKTFGRRGDLDRHRQTTSCNPNGPTVFQCHICKDHTHTRADALLRHYQNKHPGRIPPST